jgi:hypothetical protein
VPDLYDALRERGCIDPVIFRAMVRSHIGKDAPYPTIKAAADAYGVHPEQLRLFIRGKRPAEPKLLRAFGLERVELFAVAQAIEARRAETQSGSVHESAVRDSGCAQTSPGDQS